MSRYTRSSQKRVKIITSYRADFIEIEGSLGGVAVNEDADDGGEDSGHDVVSPVDRSDHYWGKLCVVWKCLYFGCLYKLF